MIRQVDAYPDIHPTMSVLNVGTNNKVFLQQTNHHAGNLVQILHGSPRSNRCVNRHTFIDLGQFLLAANQQKHARIWLRAATEDIVIQRRQKPVRVVKYQCRLHIFRSLLSQHQRQFSWFTIGADSRSIEYRTPTTVLQANDKLLPSLHQNFTQTNENVSERRLYMISK